jgi:EmrB/QacA subfamily drug resistance transporter
VFRKWQNNPWAILAVLCLGFFMTLVDLTIVNVAIPAMSDSLNGTLDEILWVVNAYTLTLSILIITAGRLGDQRGKSNLFLAGAALFTLASLACGLSRDPGELIAFRAVQGLGAALLIPQTLSIIADVFPGDQRGKALGIWGTVAGVSGAVGPSLGGWLVTDYSWRWVFYVNIPLGALVLLLGIPILPRANARTAKHTFDIVGVLLASSMLFLLAFGLIEGQRYSWHAWIWGLIGTSAVLLVVFLAYERTQQGEGKEPLLPFSLFRDRNFSIVNVAGMTVSFGVVGVLLPTTIYMQSVLDFTPLRAGVVLIPLALGSMFTAGPAGILAEKYGGRFVLAFGGGLVWFLEVAKTGTTWDALLAPVFVSGLGAGCTFAPMSSEVMRNVPPRLIGAASGANNALRQVGSVLAGALLGAVLQTRLNADLLNTAKSSAQSLPAQYRAGFVTQLLSSSGNQGLKVGPTQAAGAVPQGVPASVLASYERLADQVFRAGFVDALKPTMWVAAGVIFAGGVLCLALKGGATPSGGAHGMPAAAPAERENVGGAHAFD